MGLDGWKKVDPNAQAESIERVRQRNDAGIKESRTNQKGLGERLSDLKKGSQRSEAEGKEGKEAKIKTGREAVAAGTKTPDSVPPGVKRGVAPVKTSSTETTAPKGETAKADQSKVDPKSPPKNFDPSTQQKLEAQKYPHRSSFVPQTETPKLVSEMLGKYVPPTPPKGKEGEKTKTKESHQQMQDAAKLAEQKGPKGPVAPPPAAGEGAKLADARLKDKNGDSKTDEKDSKKSSEGKGAGGASAGKGIGETRSGELGAAAGGLASESESVPVEDRPVSYAINLERGAVSHDRVRRLSDQFLQLEKRMPFDPEATRMVLEWAKKVDAEAAEVLRVYGVGVRGIVG